jgi:hypothetical protein
MNLKKFTGLVLLAACVLVSTLPANAANWKSISFISGDVQSVCITNGVSLTNLASVGVITTNITGLTYTNYGGTRVVYDGTNQFVANKNLCIDVPLYADANGNTTIIPVSDVAGAVTNAYLNCGIFIRVQGTSGANTAIPFIFVPLWDGVNESTVAADALSISVTPSGATRVDKYVPIPAWKWPGAGKVRLKSASNADADATSRVDILNVSLNGFIP